MRRTALHGLREAYALRGDDLDALLPTSVQVVAKLFKASDTRLAQEALLTVAALVRATAKKSVYEHDLIWKALASALAVIHPQPI